MKNTIITLVVIVLVIIGAVWLFSGSSDTVVDNQNGSETETTTVLIYFGNSQMSNGTDCSEVFAVERTVSSTEAIGTAALNELLAGPTTEEEKEDFFTSLPEGVELNSLTIENGTARPDFNETLNEGGGSCMMAARAAQITQTLKAFPTVDNVTISVNGDTDMVLQP